MSEIVINLRAVDRKRLNSLHERTTANLDHSDIWYIHTVLAQCFLPYRDPKSHAWTRKNGDFSIALMAGHVEDQRAEGGLGLPDFPTGPNPDCSRATSVRKSSNISRRLFRWNAP